MQKKAVRKQVCYFSVPLVCSLQMVVRSLLLAPNGLFSKAAREFPGRRLRVVAAFSGDKDSEVCLATILKHAAPERIHLAEVGEKAMMMDGPSRR